MWALLYSQLSTRYEFRKCNFI